MSLNKTISSGPLQGVKVIEFAGMGPGPFACMLLSDMGAEVVRIDRPGARAANPSDIVGRGRKTLLLDLKLESARTQVLELLTRADALVEGFRPRVMERLGLGPEVVAQRNPRLVYGRMTGWGQTGPLAQAAAHDINYIALSGALAAIGEKSRQPVPPLNLVGDYGGGSLYLVMGILAALLEARRSGLGQVVDAAICDGVVSLMSNNQGHTLRGIYQEERGSNMLDGGAPYYSVYVTSDGHSVSLGAIESKFFTLMCEKLELPQSLWNAQNDRARWPQLKEAIAGSIAMRSRKEWSRLLEGTDVCFAPVLTLQEAKDHPHIQARKSFIDVDGVTHTAPAPRFSRTPASINVGAGGETSVDELLVLWTSNV
ncbi:carnitine dehydratase [Comamonas testosteroni TK102]|uniref:Carnitine dehydratase n=1 Tax=Comamonas testosteroni TK102 TaxID=1392005 RepID=A0A076PUG8_COMTE|nr:MULTISPECIES: CaiB/BaiF CoA-transferase family protein [Comamonas]AIJ49363.1 carnitine dehydratase [Comamonas testosteroni TK102]MPS89321.1 CoA transferase [Comamonas sp.]